MYRYITKKTTYTLAVTYEDGDGKMTIPFKGVKGTGTLSYDMVWSTATAASRVYV